MPGMFMLGALAALGPAPAAGTADEIVVTAPCRLTARQLRPALKAYRTGRPARAPDSILYFEADPAARREGMAVAKLSLRQGSAARPIPADAAGRFVLPSVEGKEWEIVGPCHDGALAISPLVMSPGTSPSDRRLGDMRLQCDVGWEIAQAEMSAAAGMFMRLAGACKSSRVAMYVGSARAIEAAEVVAGSVVRPVSVRADGYSYSVPIADKRLPDAARVRFRFR